MAGRLVTENEGGKTMKYITFAVPCYNSQDYMERCIDSLVKGGEDVEILIIDDGSSDNTGAIADRYEVIYPGIVKAVHQENGGHGAGVNKGLELAQGLYYKVVDSDDWLDADAYESLLTKIKGYYGGNGQEEAGSGEMRPEGIDEGACVSEAAPDLFVCNYIYDHLEEGTSRRMHYRNVFPADRICTWNEINHFHPSQYLIMHALVYRTEVLRESGIRLPEHTFYVDNLFAYQPLPFVKSICYMDIDLYHYFLGRDDQSVNEKVLMRRIDQQIKVTELVAHCMDLQEVAENTSPKLAAYMRRNISIMMAISSIHLLLIRSEEAQRKRELLWKGIKSSNRRLYYQLKYGTVSGLTCLPGKVGGMVTIGGYRIAKKVYQFQ